MTQERIFLSKINQTEDKYCLILIICGIKKKWDSETESRMLFAMGLGWKK